MLVLAVMSLDAKGLAQSLIKLRETLHLSQSEVARRSKNGGFKGISNGYLSQLESGQVLPETLTIKKINALARGFNIPPQRLFDLIIERNEKNPTIDEISNYLNILPESRREDLLGIAKFFYSQKSQSGNESVEKSPEQPSQPVLKVPYSKSGEKEIKLEKRKKSG